MKSVKIALTLAVIISCNVCAQRSILDIFVPTLRLIRQRSLDVFRTSEDSNNLRLSEKRNKLQPQIDKEIKFPCSINSTRSKKRPTSVHRLRPGDIDVIAAMGDSLTAGNGITSTTLFHVFLENRGISFSIGGQGTWRKFLTLPNILKEFNPNLIGFSLKDSYTFQRESQFNVAEAGAISENTPYMSKILIKRIYNDKRVDIKRDWKMITFLIGPNDFCSEMCYYDNPFVIIEKHRKDLLAVLRNLRDNLPRTIVNLIITPNLQILANFSLENKPKHCHYTHSISCPCLFGLVYKHKQQMFNTVMNKWQEMQMEVANYPEFDRDDFTVVVQPFTIQFSVPKTPAGYSDYSITAEDCFHLSQKGNAIVANSLWNNILEPVGSKSYTSVETFKSFHCPTKERPYIFTKRNSNV